MNKKKKLLLNWWLNGGSAAVPTVDYATQGYDLLVSNARTFHDFFQLSGSHGGTITNSNDLTANNRDLTNAPGGLYTPNTPTVFSYKFPNLESVKAHYTFSNQPLFFLNNTTNAIFATSHEIHLALTAKSKNFILRLFGVDSTQVHNAVIETDGKVSIYIKRAATTTRLRTVAAVFTQSVQNGDLGSVIVLGFRYNFTAGSEQAIIYVNGTAVATELVSGSAVASWDSAYTWNNLYSFAIGAVAAASNSTGNAKPHWNYKFCVTPLLSQDQRNLVVHQMLSTAPQSGKLVFLADFKMPICTGNKTYHAGVYLSEQPASDVTVTVSANSDVNITGTSLTFTPANYNVPQLVKVVGSTNFGRREVDVTFTMTGGFTGAVVKEIIVAQSLAGIGGKDGSEVYMTDGWNACRTEADAISIPSASALRDSIKTTLFKSSYPSGAANSSSSVTGYAGVTLTNVKAASITNYMFRALDEAGYQYDNNVGFVRNTTPNNKLFIQLFGHGESFHQEMYNEVIALGYDWAGACLAFSVANTENNPNLTGSPSWLAHDQLYTAGVDTATFDGRSLFFHDKIRFLDYILTQNTYDEIIVAGISGGGWAATMWASFDERITKTFNVRGCNSYNHPESGSDFEQGPSFLTEFTGGAAASEAVCGPRVTADYRALGYLKRMMAVCANGADYHQISHELDPYGGSYYNEIPYDIMQTKAQALGGGSFNVFVNTDSGEATHGFNTSDRAYIIANL